MGRAPTRTKNGVVTQSIRQILNRAASNGVSDVHIEPGERFVLVRYRRGGLLYVANKLPPHTAEKLARELKTLSGLDSNQVNAPQRGEADVTFDSETYHIGVATLPVLDGEKLTVHIQNSTPLPNALEQLGLWGSPLKQVNHALGEPSGLMLVGSRQARPALLSIATMLQKIQKPINRQAIVEPGDITLPDKVKRVAGNPGLQLHLLAKRDYDVIALGELSERSAARQVDNLARHNRKIIVRLPNSGAVQGLSAWQKLLGEPTTVHPISIAQIQARSLCQYCHEPYEPTIIEQIEFNELFHVNQDSTMKQLHALERQALDDGLGVDEPLASSAHGVHRLWRASIDGCQHCDRTGYSSAINIFEVYKPSDDFFRELLKGKAVSELQQIAIKEGMISLKVDALIKALRGLIDFQTVLRVCAES